MKTYCKSGEPRYQTEILPFCNPAECLTSLAPRSREFHGLIISCVKRVLFDQSGNCCFSIYLNIFSHQCYTGQDLIYLYHTLLHWFPF